MITDILRQLRSFIFSTAAQVTGEQLYYTMIVVGILGVIRVVIPPRSKTY